MVTEENIQTSQSQANDPCVVIERVVLWPAALPSRILQTVVQQQPTDTNRDEEKREHPKDVHARFVFNFVSFVLDRTQLLAHPGTNNPESATRLCVPMPGIQHCRN